MNGDGYVQTLNNHVPTEVLDKFMAQYEERFRQYDERFKSMEALCGRLTDIIEKYVQGIGKNEKQPRGLRSDTAAPRAERRHGPAMHIAH